MKILVIGGSIGGLCAGIALLERGFDVEIYERSSGALKDRGAGLVIQPDMMEYLVEAGVSTREIFGVLAAHRQVLDDNGNPSLIYPNDTVFTSWNYLWKQLRNSFPSLKYHQGYELTSVQDQQEKVIASFKNGKVIQADLLIGADGVNSVVREYLFPGNHPRYAGYIAYRGLIPESELNVEEIAFFSDKFSIYPYANSHLLCYTIPGPGGELKEGKRLLNWVWFQNKSSVELRKILTDKDGRLHEFSIPAGYLSEESVSELKARADDELPEILRKRVYQTKNPFVQVILDMEVPKMFQGNVAILGDAAYLVRPHTASGSAKAYRDAITLAMDIQETAHLQTALKIWNDQQIAHARALAMHGQQLALRSGLGK
ncbi:FAD-dependent monooxygenase [Pedobacter sp. BMA]|uniref:FAD binding domain-containing protein n=1 Tax=Pedobacter sp. BMA TaxID=1663685 RepID=UPI00064966F9|nr:FAD-dependent monooxygenase [Pedobacter sp. BMA]KLT65638.1 monooxygenase [Pedobacter sp. BMA]